MVNCQAPKIMESTPSNQKAPEDVEKRQCWECQRRRLVCDGIRPVCNKCKTNKVVCPGYEDKKPLVWLAPGKVTSRVRRAKPTASKKNGPGKATEEKTEALMCQKKAQPMVETVSRIDLRSDAEDVVQAIYYYNASIFPSWESVRKLAPGGCEWLVPIPLDALHNVDASIRHSLTLCAIEYRLHYLTGATSSNSSDGDDLRSMRTKSLYHRDVAIRALSEAIGDDKRRATDVTIVGVLMFLLIDIRQCALNWRYHFVGLTSLMELRGGPNEYFRLVPHLKILIAYYYIVGVIGNTTSPAHDLLYPTQHAEYIDLIKMMYEDGLFPTLLSPPALFYILVRINLLRQQASQACEPTNALQSQARRIMEEIELFSPADWTGSLSSCGPGLLLVAQMHQSAVMVYCISSMQSVQVLPRSTTIDSLKKIHHKRLLSLLREGMFSTELKPGLLKCTMWLLLVAGTELRTGSLADQAFVEEQLEDMCQDIGSSLPRLGTIVLRRFWNSERAGWDDCFEKPYAFVT
ncbi:fungal-specific transcription factor domain-containing protein [Truncatella angustata]|uniref:Fungal-specific transcription factor domain-containing protein n=1 Tax=Truncatella angustata TaxID=152316 RepID=A0A9P9A1Y4_9PEZI|nr:fungal-specific transcription factor domain-containing protein [Truncatella angustata]KAH6657425.1 fungal-specific transcription factor domain-containing protein [Truncatella angustata]